MMNRLIRSIGRHATLLLLILILAPAVAYAQDEVSQETFTVNNTGALGSVVSRPLVNYPQAAIITTEAIVKRPVVVNDAIAIRSMMNVCLSFDHRILDGSNASAFLNDVKQRLEAIGPDTGIY